MTKILEVKDLKQNFVLTTDFLDRIKFKGGKLNYEIKLVNAVNGVSFHINKGEVFSLVGESGCGKSTTAKTILKLIEPKNGHIIYKGEDITEYNDKKMYPFRKDMQVVFQDPYSSLNPRQKVRDILAEPMLYHKIVNKKVEAYRKAEDLLRRVGLSEEHSSRYPHQFSGGQRQRICIARALSVNPSFIIADEPVSALDVSIQAQILNLLLDLKDELGLSLLVIAHNLSVVKHISDRLAIMYLGKIVEQGTKEQIFENPLHPYTRALFSSVPTINEEPITEFIKLKGEIPSGLSLPEGCYFHERCPHTETICRKDYPEMIEVEKGHFVSCHLFNGNWPHSSL